ncbi:MAG: hypothetical protein HKM93_06645 [Desulfobacteraceae bacterium]|nr:hypothetical protein [Desulfobacteraceae bacterium]
MNEFITNLCMTVIMYGADNLMTMMVLVFCTGIVIKLLLYLLLRMEHSFSSGFETRAHRYLNDEYKDAKAFTKFSDSVEYVLKRTYQELYIKRKKQFRRRKEDSRVDLVNRIFLIEEGAKSLILDTLKQTKYHNSRNAPNFKNISKFVFRSNPYYTKLWGVIPVALTNNVLSILPSLFIIGGIFGTFLGISKGLPALKMIDPSDVAASQTTLRLFLESMTFAMYSSVVGIFLSATFTIMNSFLSFNAVYLRLVDKFTQSLELLWKDAVLKD